MMLRQVIRLISTLVIAGTWLAVACVPTLSPVDERALLTFLKSAQVPVAEVTTTNQCVTIDISDDIEGPAAKQVAATVFNGICMYAQGYRFTIQYPSGTHTSLRWRQVQAYCEGEATMEQVEYVYYSTPSDKTTCGSK